MTADSRSGGDHDLWWSVCRGSTALARALYEGLVLTGTTWSSSISTHAAQSARRVADHEAALGERADPVAQEEFAYLEALWRR